MAKNRMGARVTPESNRRVQQQFDKVDRAATEQLSAVVFETATNIHSDTVRSAPVVTSSLKTSYQVDTRKIKQQEASVYTENYYSVYVEYGTGIYAEGGGGRQTPWSYINVYGEWVTTQGQRPQPHFRPAIQKHEERFFKAVDNLIKQSLK